jgi:hypothetical protein
MFKGVLIVAPAARADSLECGLAGRCCAVGPLARYLSDEEVLGFALGPLTRYL